MSRHVIKFTLDMQNEMDNNSGKTDWRRLTPRQCLHRLRQETKELAKAINQNKITADVISECADVANFAMFLAHNYKQKVKDEN